MAGCTKVGCGGSSPPVRGTVWRRSISIVLLRFIPARAGNRADSLRGRPGFTVHPRPCGEQDMTGAMLYSPSGSSPPVRGTDFFYFIKIIEVIVQQKIHQH